MVEHYLDTVGVTGSNPVSRTTFYPKSTAGVRIDLRYAKASFQVCSTESSLKLTLARLGQRKVQACLVVNKLYR